MMTQIFLEFINFGSFTRIVPESFGVFVFGGGLVVLAVGMRRLLGKNEARNRENLEKTIG